MKNQNVSVFFENQKSVLAESEIIRLVSKILTENQVKASEISIIFVNNDFITRLNSKFFDKSRPTDVISFPLSEPAASVLEGEVYIATEVAQTQATDYGVSLQNELFRLVIHGVLHLLGYDDLTVPEKSKMTEQEDFYLHYIFADS